MTVLDVLKTASVYLNKLSDFDYYFNEDNNTTPSSEVQNDFAKLLKCLNIVIKEIAGEYVPVKKIESALFESNSFDVGDLTEDVCQVFEITFNNKRKRFKVVGDNIVSDFSGNAQIEYSYYPEEFEEDDDLNIFAGKIGEKTFVMGTVSEYYFINCIYDDAEMYRQKFEESLKGNLRKLGKFSLPCERWI